MAAIVAGSALAARPEAQADSAGPGGVRGGSGMTAMAAPQDACLDPAPRRERRLLCPDLRMRPPFHLQADRRADGAPILRAANSIDSVGDGPAELRGRRSGRLSMVARQRVHKKGGGRTSFDTGAKLAFKWIPGQGRFWKFRDAARFELWQLGDDGERRRRVEVGPKQVYCLRDLDHTHPGLRGSPGSRVYPRCNQNPNQAEVTLGTSVGWSDVYSHTYHQNFIELDDVPAGGCYAYVHIADPKNGIFELDESNNEASTVVYLTAGGDWVPGRCEGVRDRALPRSQTTDDSAVRGQGDGGDGGGGWDGGGAYRAPA